jgi:glutamate-1-semialdehyde 2,1-aminomutase
MINSWEYSETDKIYSDKLCGFLPEKVFDSHAHLYRISDLNIGGRTYMHEGPAEAGYRVWKDNVGKIVNGSELCGGLFFPMVSRDCDIESSNAFLPGQLALSPESRGLMLVTPDTDEKTIDRYLSYPQIIGFKPYFYFSREKPVEESSITGFLPEWIWETAHCRKLAIVLHIVRRKALADPDNRDVICGMCREYPGVKLILAHAARGFNPQNTIDGLEALYGYDNIYFDSSSICEAKALKAVLKRFGSKKLLWGTDFPDSQIHGKCVSAGNGFIWLDNTTVNWDKLGSTCEPVLFGIESILAVREAAEDLGLDKDDMENIFYRNAQDLFIKK